MKSSRESTVGRPNNAQEQLCTVSGHGCSRALQSGSFFLFEYILLQRTSYVRIAMSGSGDEESELPVVATINDVAPEHFEELYHLGEAWRTTKSTYFYPF